MTTVQKRFMLNCRSKKLKAKKTFIQWILFNPTFSGQRLVLRVEYV